MVENRKGGELNMEKALIFIWIAIVSSFIALLAYSFWNFFVVLFDLLRLGREVKQAMKKT
jgi:hypothetical protein